MAATFVVEDGTGKTDANSYASVATADQFHEDYGTPRSWFGLVGDTFSMNDTDNSLNDSASQLLSFGFAAGDFIAISGFTDSTNNETFQAKTVAAGKIVFERTNLVTTEAAGDEVTVRPDPETHLRLATRYLETRYANRWEGTRYSDTQALAFPRYGVRIDSHLLDYDTLPDALIQACCYLAGVSAAGDSLLPSISSPGLIKRKKIKAGPVEKDVTYVGGVSTSTSTKRYPIAEGYLRDIVEDGATLERC